jgi:pimeloyl-ACP methyl ester carboxylesterase
MKPMDAIPADRRKTTLVTPDGVEIVLEQSGNPAGREIVFIHGFSISRLCWMKQLRGMLTRDFRMVAYDLRGHGESAKPSDPAFYREGHRWAGELAAVIDAAEMRQPVLVAWSYAGRIVADYLRHFGTGAIAGLNIIGAKTNSDPAFNAPLLAPHQRGMASGDLETNVRSTIAFVEACARQWDAPDFAQQVAAAMVVPPYVRAALLGRPLDADDLYRAIDIPVLFSHGAGDPIAPLAAARHGHAITPNSQLSIYENAGHAPFLEEPERFNRELAEFVARCKA